LPGDKLHFEPLGFGFPWQDARMNNGYGIEARHPADPTPHRIPVHFVVVIDSGGSPVAMLFSAQRELIEQFDAGTEETASLMRDLVPERCAIDPLWDRALQGHGPDERRAADVYTLHV